MEFRTRFVHTRYFRRNEEIDLENGEVFTDPIVFIPVVEDRDIDSLKHELCEVPAQAVIAMEYDTSSLTCIGYDLDSYNNLSQTSSIDEDLAWTTDVWVFSQEEVTGTNIAGGRSVSYIDEAEINYQQIVDGRTEYGGLIQVTDLGRIESWIAGKQELRY